MYTVFKDSAVLNSNGAKCIQTVWDNDKYI